VVERLVWLTVKLVVLTVKLVALTVKLVVLTVKLVVLTVELAVELRQMKIVQELRVILMTMESVLVLRKRRGSRGLQRRKRVVLLALMMQARSALVLELARVLLGCLVPTVPVEHLLWVLARP
jgi:hypothetical protein